MTNKKMIAVLIVSPLVLSSCSQDDMEFTPQPTQKEVTYRNTAECVKDIGVNLCGVSQPVKQDVSQQFAQQSKATCDNGILNSTENPTATCTQTHSSGGAYVYRGSGNNYNGSQLTAPEYPRGSNNYNALSAEKPVTVKVPINTVTNGATSVKPISSGAVKSSGSSTRGGFGTSGAARGGSFGRSFGG